MAWYHRISNFWQSRTSQNFGGPCSTGTKHHLPPWKTVPSTVCAAAWSKKLISLEREAKSKLCKLCDSSFLLESYMYFSTELSELYWPNHRKPNVYLGKLWIFCLKSILLSSVHDKWWFKEKGKIFSAKDNILNFDKLGFY